MGRHEEKSGVHVTGEDSGWPVAAPEEPGPTKDGTGRDPHPDVTAVTDGVVETKGASSKKTEEKSGSASEKAATEKKASESSSS